MMPFPLVEATELYTPIAVKLIDAVTGSAPLAPVKTFLELRDSAGAWIPQKRNPVPTPGGLLTFPGLGRRGHASGVSPEKYRLRFESDIYQPDYLGKPLSLEGIEFDSFPYNDDTPPAVFATSVTDVVLHPSPRYPFLPSTPILRGFVVRQGTTNRVAAALVAEALHDRTITDKTGEFALALRQVKPNIATSIDVTDFLSTPNETGITVILLPAALGISHTIGIA